MANTEASPGNTTDFGDFVKDEEEELDLEELVEPWHRYDTEDNQHVLYPCLLYTSPSPRDGLLSRMPSSA